VVIGDLTPPAIISCPAYSCFYSFYLLETQEIFDGDCPAEKVCI